MSATYYEISRQEMEDCLLTKGFKQVPVEGVTELVYDFKHPKADEKLGIRVYSSIAYGSARKKGRDAIRCFYFDFEHDRSFMSTKRIHRIQTWEKNLTNRLRLMAGMVVRFKEVACPFCSGMLVERKGQYGKFFGCLNYPDCKGTRELDTVTSFINKNENEVREMLKGAGKWL